MTVKHDRIRAEAYRRVELLAWRIEQHFCTCSPAYISRGLVSPECRAHDIKYFILEWVEAEGERRQVAITPPHVYPACTCWAQTPYRGNWHSPKCLLFEED